MQHARAASQAEPEIEQDDFTTREPSPEGSRRLVVVTYNIRYAVGSHLIGGSLLRRAGLRWPGRRPRLVGENIRKAARLLSDGAHLPRADVIALQEADSGTLRAGGRHVARELAAELRMGYVRAHVPTPKDVEPKGRKWWLDFEERMLRGEDGDTGVALLSRLPLSSPERIELPWDTCPWRPRLAVAASVPFGGSRLHVFNAHIDTHANVEGQLRQHRTILALAERTPEPAVLLGDFNTLNDEGRQAARSLLEENGYTTPMRTNTPTWRSGPIRHHFDWIFVRGARALRWGVARVRGISDHWPVWVELEPE
ncbi:MAG: endonuclease/exonuclease/phosphatase family protein [Acidobacteria bacterium]|nr:endonuclease/exonuclease/phosphatase family protein [Acidobacteriota bacterium]